ncbi:uncharacterized protein LOC133884959 [Phragmites australis]|uniref:uncharacterized protein LOC133884959 n=1 Tax=Phragmites australis TaxID=29695 RepID=UPI002D796087|nr:uncharacterized protein LOC133884959 [Phragmites australis]
MAGREGQGLPHHHRCDARFLSAAQPSAICFQPSPPRARAAAQWDLPVSSVVSAAPRNNPRPTAFSPLHTCKNPRKPSAIAAAVAEPSAAPSPPRRVRARRQLRSSGRNSFCCSPTHLHRRTEFSPLAGSFRARRFRPSAVAAGSPSTSERRRPPLSSPVAVKTSPAVDKPPVSFPVPSPFGCAFFPKSWRSVALDCVSPAILRRDPRRRRRVPIAAGLFFPQSISAVGSPLNPFATQ